MADSILPALGDWWWSKGKRQNGAVYLYAGASTTPYDGAAAPVGSRKFTLEITYTSGNSNQIDVRVNWFNDAKAKVAGPFDIKTFNLPSAQAGTSLLEVELPADPRPRWLPSLLIPASGHDILVHSLKVYETPAPAPQGPATAVWNGTDEIGVAVTVWDGANEIPTTIEIQA
nr:MAG TPA: hypothetical protein [Caudoviricetes sp.]